MLNGVIVLCFQVIVVQGLVVFDYNGMLLMLVVQLIFGVMISNCDFGMLVVLGMLMVMLLGLIYVFNVSVMMLVNVMIVGQIVNMMIIDK